MNLRGIARRPSTLPVDMTPLIDTVFLLLMFFLTTTQLVTFARLDLNLPRERGEQRRGSETPGLIVNLREDGAVIVLDEEVSHAEIAALAASARAERQARGDLTPLRPVVRADRRAPAERLNALLTVLRDAGVDGVTFAVSPGG